MQDVFYEILCFFKGKGWILQVFLTIFFALILSYVVGRVYKKLLPKLKKTHFAWDEALLEALIRPLRFLIWVLGVALATEIIESRAGHTLLFKTIDTLRNLLCVFALIWFLLRFIKNMERIYIIEQRKSKKNYDQTTVRALCQIFRIAVLITGALIGLQSIGIPISAVLAFGGAGGIVIGFAAKDLLANFFGGLMVFLDRPFSVGDWIRSPDKEIEGTVEHIGWRLTRIRTFDKRPLYVPNGLFSTISVQNPSRMSNRRIYRKISVRYQDAPLVHEMLNDVEEMLKNHPEIDTNQILMVYLSEFGPCSLDFFLYTFTKTTNWVKFQKIQQDVLLKTMEVIKRHGASCAFPTTTLDIPDSIPVQLQQ